MLFESTPAEFQSAFDLEESVARLRAATQRSAFASLGEQAAVGKVAEDRVRLRRVIPMVRNSFQPIFVGRFESRGGKLMLIGTFAISPVVKVVMTFWLSVVGVFALATLLGAFDPRGPYALLFRLQPFLMLGFGLAIVALGKWFARNDAAWLSDVIHAALGGGPPAAAAPHGVVARVSGPPIVLQVAAGFLALSGLVSLAIGVFGFLIPSGAPPVTRLPAVWSEVFGLGSIALCVGVWNRQRWAWWGGFGVLSVSFAASWYGLPGSFAQLQPLPLRVLFGAFAALVTVVWARWWYAQRPYFC
jgi:hypothetical protein